MCCIVTGNKQIRFVQHFVHTPCTLMPQRGLCTVLEEEEEEDHFEDDTYYS